MTTLSNNGGPAFPAGCLDAWGSVRSPGMTLRQYASITLRVPESGTDWLDDMIRQSLRDEFAAKAMIGLIYAPDRADQSREECTRLAYLMSDAMLQARKGGAA